MMMMMMYDDDDDDDDDFGDRMRSSLGAGSQPNCGLSHWLSRTGTEYRGKLKQRFQPATLQAADQGQGPPVTEVGAAIYDARCTDKAFTTPGAQRPGGVTPREVSQEKYGMSRTRDDVRQLGSGGN